MDLEQTNAKANFNEASTRPLTVLVLTFDSVSRKHFYRTLPKTKEFLSALNPKKHRVFDFKIHNVQGDNSIPNVYPILTGRPLTSLFAKERTERKQSQSDFIGEHSIWEYMKKRVILI